jgi:hypothetical protein
MCTFEAAGLSTTEAPPPRLARGSAGLHAPGDSAFSAFKIAEMDNWTTKRGFRIQIADI